MASWTDIPNSSIESGAPIRAVDGLALRDNPIAIAEGQAGAPRIQNAGINDGAVTNAKIANGTIGSEKLQTGVEESNWVTGRYSQVTAGEIGAVCVSATFTVKGSTIAGSSLKYFNDFDGLGEPDYESLGMSGTWRSLGGASNYNVYRTCLYVRIA